MNEMELIEIEEETKRLRLLYVEDNPEARSSTLLILEQFFDYIEVGVDGQDGYEKFKNGHFDLIMSDINMPRLNGIEMIRLIRKENLAIPILVLSAYNEQNFFIDGIKAGIEGYLLKPIDIDQFMDIMTRVIYRMKLRRENEAYKTNLEQMVAQQTKEIKTKAERIYYQALTDQLTGLYNSAMLNQLLEKGSYKFLIYLDIVNFKTINKQYGKKFGNKVIQAASKALEKNIKKEMRLFKIESDRFAILSKERDANVITEFSKQIIAFFDMTNLWIDENEININFTIGAAAVSEENDLLMECEYALDWAKHVGRRTYYIYEAQSSSMQNEQETIGWLNRTKRMIVENKIEPYFQPIYDLKSKTIVKYEVLARAIEDGEVYAPIFFLGAAERLGLLTAITKIMINKSFAFFSKNTYHFSINITERDLLEEGFNDFIIEKARHYHIDPSRITCEILEGVTLGLNINEIVAKLNGLRDQGFLLAIDDFGVENSNFSRLLEIELDFIKIDGIFIRNIVNSQKDENIVRAIVNLAKTLEIKTVAEFVESQEIMDKILECGIDYAQGYHIGRPENALLEL
jgi:diguanylate cyclase (GGDEF)-like protein